MKSVNKPETVEAYIDSIPLVSRDAFLEFRKIIIDAAPGYKEVIGYGMPGLKKDHILLYYACFKSHMSLFGFPESVVVFKEKLEGYKTSKGTIQFPLDKKLPKKLITDIVKYRVSKDKEKASAKQKKSL